MELAPVTEPWTAAVPWARAWRRHPAPCRPAAARPEAATPARAESRAQPAAQPIAHGDPRLEIAWTLALIELAAARLRLAEAAAGDDPWVEAMAGHAVHLAVRQVRALQVQLGDPDEPLRWTAV